MVGEFKVELFEVSILSVSFWRFTELKRELEEVEISSLPVVRPIYETSKPNSDALKSVYRRMAANGSVRSNITNHESNGFDSKRFGSVTQTQSISSIGRTSSNTGSSFRRLFSLQDGTYTQLDEDTENEIMSQAGDIGDRQLSRRASHERPSLRFSMDDGVVFPVPEDFLESYGFWSNDPSKLNTVSPVSPLPSEIVSPIATPLPNQPILHKKQVQEEAKQLPPSLEYIACLVYLAVFGILGVILLLFLCDL